MPRKKQVSSVDLQKELKKIYTNDDGDPLDMSFFERRPSRAKTKILFSLLFFFAFLAGVSWLGFFLFSPGQKFSEDRIKLTVEAPEAVSAGSTVTLKISYRNDQKIPLGEASLIVRYPRGFKISKVEPSAFNKENTEWSLGALTKDNPGAVTISGVASGVKDEILSFRVFLNYKPANFNAEFQKIITRNLRLEGAPLEASFTGPDELEAGKPADYEITYKNSGSEAIKNLLARLTTPFGFKINSISPSAGALPQKTAESEINSIGPVAINPGEELKIKISGSFTAQAPGGSKNFSAELFLKADDQAYSQGSISKTTELAATTVKLGLTANNSAEKQSINFEDKIVFAMSYENIGQLALKNAVLRLVLETPSVDNKSLLSWSDLADPNNGAVDGEQINKNTRVGSITWTKQEVKELSELKPGDKGSVSVTLPVKSKREFDAARLTSWHIKAYGELKTDKTDSTALQSNILDLTLGTDLALAAKTTLKETKNQVNTYVVNWTLTNTLHEITNVLLSATLPKNVDWGGLVSVSAGDLAFDKVTRQVTWSVNRIPISFPKTEISFAITFKNEAGQKAAEITLLDKTRVEAKDKATGEQILLSKEPLLVQL